MRGRSKLFALAVALAATASEAATKPTKCGSPPPSWRTHFALQNATFNRVQVYRDGSIRWNGKIATSENIADYALISSTMWPTSLIVLYYEEGAPCDRVIAIRTVIDEEGSCAETHACVDGGAIPNFGQYGP
jgi:hypothetical protein